MAGERLWRKEKEKDYSHIGEICINAATIEKNGDYIV